MTRMWMVDVEFMCNQHLLGEHKEIHQLLGSLRKNRSINGYVEKGLVEPLSMTQRHDEIVTEMLNRGMKHHTPLEMTFEDLSNLTQEQANSKVNRAKSVWDLMTRCSQCKQQYKEVATL